MPINPNPPMRNPDGSIVAPSAPEPQQTAKAMVSTQRGDGTWRFPDNSVDVRQRNPDGTLVVGPQVQALVDGSIKGSDGVWRYVDGRVDLRTRDEDGMLLVIPSMASAPATQFPVNPALTTADSPAMERMTLQGESVRQADGTWRYPDGSIDNRQRNADGSPYVSPTNAPTSGPKEESVRGSDGIWRYADGRIDQRARNSDGSLRDAATAATTAIMEGNPQVGPMKGEPSFGSERPAKPAGAESGQSTLQEDGSWKFPDGTVDRRVRNPKGELAGTAQPLSSTLPKGESTKQKDGTWKFPDGTLDRRARDKSGNLV